MTAGVFTLVVTVMLENDVLEADAGGVKGEDLGNSIIVQSGGRGSGNRTGHKRTHGEGSHYGSRGDTTFTKEDLSDVLEWKASSCVDIEVFTRNIFHDLPSVGASPMFHVERYCSVWGMLHVIRLLWIFAKFAR